MADPTVSKSAFEQALPQGPGASLVDSDGGFRLPAGAPPIPLGDRAGAVFAALGFGDLHAAMPEDVRRLASPSLDLLEVTPTDGGATDVALAVHWPDTFDVIPGLIAIDAPGLLYQSTTAGTEVDRALTLFGVVDFAGLCLDTRVEILHGSGEIELLQRDEPTTLRPLLELFHASGSPFDALQILDLKASFDVRDRSVMFWLSVGALDLYHGPSAKLTLDKLELLLDYAGGPGSAMQTRVAGCVSLAVPRGDAQQTIALRLAATRPGPGAGWRFEGGLKLDPPVGVVALASTISGATGGPRLDAPVDLEIAELAATFDTHTRDITFHAAADLDLGPLALPLRLDLASTHDADGAVHRQITGHLDIPVGDAPLRFAAVFDSERHADADETLIGAAFADEAGRRVGLGDLVAAIDALDDPTREGLNALSFSIHRAGLALLRKRARGKAAPSRYLFKAEVDGGVDISALPLVGERLPAGSRLALELAPIYKKGIFTAAELTHISGLLPELGDLGGEGEGLQIGVALRVGDQRITFDQARQKAAGAPDPAQLQDAMRTRPGTVPAAPAAAELPAPPPPPDVTWVPIQKRLGPIGLQRVGVGFALADKRITVLLDASLGLAGLDLSLMGLGASYALDTRALTFHLDGIGLHLDKGAVRITGLFLRMGEDSFVGEARVQAATWSLGALGAYGKVQGKTSVFLYAFLNAPLGGPAFFFVEGLALGFGYNRDLVVPPIREIAAFPLVAEVMGTAPAGLAASATPVASSAPELPGTGAPGQAQADAVRTKLSTLEKYLRPTAGQHFIAVGIKFSSFKLIKCFALAAVSFGQELKIDVLGVGTLEYPPEAPFKAAFVELAFAVRIHPDEGFFAAEAALTPRSFLLDPSVHLTGGAAFYAWAKSGRWQGHDVRAGDFVLTVGGYHPDYKVPAHYPQVDLLGLSWALSTNMWIKGGFYFALCPDAVMFGGRLQAHFAAGPLRADFLLTIDFILRWKPFFFEGRIHIEFSVALDLGLFDISGSFAAELDVWGPGPRPEDPRLSGHARIKIGPTSASVSFGQDKRPAPPLSWSDFHAAFVPAGATGTRVAGGLVRTLPLADPADPHAERAVIEPKNFALETHSVVPLSGWSAGARSAEGLEQLQPPPMGGAIALTSVQTLTLAAAPVGVDLSAFTIEVVRQGFPTALWGGAGERVLDRAAGLRLTPARPPLPGASRTLSREALGYTTTARLVSGAHAREPGPPAPSSWREDAPTPAERDAFARALRDGAPARRELAAAYGLRRTGALDAARVAAAATDLPEFSHG